jgi:hypothetical protein
VNEPISLPSGRSLQVQIAPFAAGSKLFKAIVAELRTVELDFAQFNLTKLDPSMDVMEFVKKNPRAVDILKNVIFEVASSDSVEAALWECMTRCLIDTKKIDRQSTFESEDARADYIPTAWEVIKVNTFPFFKGIASSFSTSGAPSESDQKSGVT